MGIIQRQSIKSTFVILAGFAIGAVNLLILFPAFFSQTEIGMTRALMDISLTLSVLATLGSLPVIYKFYPFYKDYLAKNKNDLPFLSAVVCLIGFLLVLCGGYIFQDWIIRKLGKSPEFAQYFYVVYPFTFLFLTFLWLEAFAWGLKKTTLTNFLKETLLRLIITVLIALFAAGILDLKLFMHLYSVVYLIPVAILLFILMQSGEWKLKVMLPSKVSWRMGKRMISFGLYVFSAQFLNILSRTSDTIFAIGFQGLSQTAIFSIATYIVTVMEIPQRSINSISIPVLAQSWKDRDLNTISNIYKKSVSNLLVIGTGLFCLILLIVPDVAEMLNYFGRKTHADYSIIIQIVLFMGLARVIDLGTGINAPIIATSNFWKFDFYTNILYTLISVPLNFILIKKFGILGLAYANLISLTVYNMVRYVFLLKKFGFQPYTFKSLLTLLMAAGSFFITWLMPIEAPWFFSIIIRSLIFCLIFIPLILKSNVAPEIKEVINKLAKKVMNVIKK
jgi:O-antigen/teichoic acid export membrane protein